MAEQKEELEKKIVSEVAGSALGSSCADDFADLLIDTVSFRQRLRDYEEEDTSYSVLHLALLHGGCRKADVLVTFDSSLIGKACTQSRSPLLHWLCARGDSIGVGWVVKHLLATTSFLFTVLSSAKPVVLVDTCDTIETERQTPLGFATLVSKDLACVHLVINLAVCFTEQVEFCENPLEKCYGLQLPHVLCALDADSALKVLLNDSSVPHVVHSWTDDSGDGSGQLSPVDFCLRFGSARCLELLSGHLHQHDCFTDKPSPLRSFVESASKEENFAARFHSLLSKVTCVQDLHSSAIPHQVLHTALFCDKPRASRGGVSRLCLSDKASLTPKLVQDMQKLLGVQLCVAEPVTLPSLQSLYPVDGLIPQEGAPKFKFQRRRTTWQDGSDASKLHDTLISSFLVLLQHEARKANMTTGEDDSFRKDRTWELNFILSQMKRTGWPVADTPLPTASRLTFLLSACLLAFGADPMASEGTPNPIDPTRAARPPFLCVFHRLLLESLREVADRSLIHKFVRLFLFCGADPSKPMHIPYINVTFPYISDILLGLSSDIYPVVVCAFLGAPLQTVNLLLDFMDMSSMQEAAAQLRTTNVGWTRKTSLLSDPTEYRKQLQVIAAPTVRSLKHVAKLAIWRGLGRRLGEAASLALPPTLRTYLLDDSC